MEMLSIDIVGLIGACSYALDCIEAELVNITNKHGNRVAYISVCMAKYWAIQGDALQDLAMCALLHDNALTQYISEELEKDSVIDLKKDLSEEKTNLHCIYGEKNITKLPFKTDVSNVILYHHEHADGTGPFQKKWNEIPLFARIIHLSDIVDIIEIVLNLMIIAGILYVNIFPKIRIVYLIRNVLMLFFMYSQKNPLCV